MARRVIILSASAWRPQFRGVFDQLQRSSLSVQVNIAEGYAFFTESALWRNHLRIAYGSAVETDDLPDLMAEFDHFKEAGVAETLDLCIESRKLLYGLMKKYGALKEVK